MQGNVTSILEDTGTTLDTLVKDIPTNAELATALGTADDATLAAIAALDVVVDTAAGNVLLALKLLRNKVVTDPAAGIMTVYDDNGVDVLYTANVYETAGTATPYAGNAINRKDRLA
jgi:predicted nucleotide-binding protein